CSVLEPPPPALQTREIAREVPLRHIHSIIDLYSNQSRSSTQKLLFLCLTIVSFNVIAFAQVTAVSIQSPTLSANVSTDMISAIHLQATAEDFAKVTGYVVYVDDQNVYRNFSPSVDAWIVVPPGSHTLYVKAWDARSNLATQVYDINVVS